MKEDTKYTIIQWPDILYLILESDFSEHSYLVNDEQGIEDFGSSAYFVDTDWADGIINRKKNESTHKSILKFIKRFQNEGTIKTFTQGCCYWFAVILEKRYSEANMYTQILYSPVYNHFITQIGLNFYDITGEVSAETYISWDPYQSQYPNEANKVIFDCIL